MSVIVNSQHQVYFSTYSGYTIFSEKTVCHCAYHLASLHSLGVL